VWRVADKGGAATAITQVDLSRGELFHTWPSFLPDGSRFLYFRSGPPDVAGIYAGSLDAQPGDQSRVRIVASSQPASYTAGYLFFPRAGALMAQRFDASRLQLKDAAVPIADAIRTTWYGTAVFAIAAGGSLAYRAAAGSATTQIRWTDRQGKILGSVGQPGTDSSIVLSPDGKRAVVKDAPYGAVGDLWTLDLSTAQRTRFTFRKDAYSPGVWSPDVARIAYSAGSLGDTIYERSTSGVGGERELLKETGLRHFPTSWSHDGRFLLYHTENTPRTGYDLWVLPLKDKRTPVRLLGESFNEWAGVFSPDMRWIAYVSLETGAAEIFVRPFRASGENGHAAVGEGKWQVSRDGGNWPIWHNPGEIIFHNVPAGSAAFAVPVRTTDAVFESGIPQQLFTISRGGLVNLMDFTADGQRFVMPTAETDPSARAGISVIVNWPTLLKR
jgi:Tol biopolymer transport system component